MPGPAATIGSMHICPMCTGPTPHVGGPIAGPGDPTVVHNGKPAAVQGDLCTCVGPLDMIVQGHPNIMHNGKPAVCQNDLTAHGGMVSLGEPNIVHGFVSEPMKPLLLPLEKIPFANFNYVSKARARLAGHSLKEAEAKQQAIKDWAAEERKEEPRIFNLQWIKNDTIFRASRVRKQFQLRADVVNIPEGESVTFKVKKLIGDDGRKEDYITLTGRVRDKRVTVDWEFEDDQEDPTKNT